MKNVKVTKTQIENDYNKIMEGFIENPLFHQQELLNPNIHYEQFSIYDKTLVSIPSATLF